MDSKFNLKIIVRVLLLGAVMLFFLYSLNKENWYASKIVSFLLIPFLIYDLIRFLHRTRRDLAQFLLMLQQGDLNQYAATSPGRNRNDDLYLAFHEITNMIRNVQIEKEVHYQYLQTIVNHVDIAIISYDSKGQVHLVNKAFLHLTKLRDIRLMEQLKSIDQQLFETIQKLQPGDRELIKLSIDSQALNLALYATNFRIRGRDYKLLALQDIQYELESQELESWQKLIRVLTHEIMNSVTPIASLSNAANEILSEAKQQEVVIPDYDILEDSMLTIERRSKGLLKFVKNYKSLTRLPKPQITPVDLTELIQHTVNLLRKDLETAGIIPAFHSDARTIEVLADYDMIQQVVINLLLNAKEAVIGIDSPTLEIRVKCDQLNPGKGIGVFIKDNGKGMDAAQQEKAFIPFYTTKDNGSGIGLSLSRQIMKLHGGRILLNSTPGKGTEAVLIFK